MRDEFYREVANILQSQINKLTQNNEESLARTPTYVSSDVDSDIDSDDSSHGFIIEEDEPENSLYFTEIVNFAKPRYKSSHLDKESFDLEEEEEVIHALNVVQQNNQYFDLDQETEWFTPEQISDLLLSLKILGFPLCYFNIDNEVVKLTAVEIAIHCGSQSQVDWLAHQQQRLPSHNTWLHQAVLSNDLDKAGLIMSAGGSLEQRDDLGRTVLLALVEDFDPYIHDESSILWVLSRGACTKARDEEGNTILHIMLNRINAAAECKSEENSLLPKLEALFKILLMKADPYIKNKKQESAYSLVTADQQEYIQQLSELKQSPNTPTFTPSPPLLIPRMSKISSPVAAPRPTPYPSFTAFSQRASLIFSLSGQGLCNPLKPNPQRTSHSSSLTTQTTSSADSSPSSLSSATTTLSLSLADPIAIFASPGSFSLTKGFKISKF